MEKVPDRQPLMSMLAEMSLTESKGNYLDLPLQRNVAHAHASN